MNVLVAGSKTSRVALARTRWTSISRSRADDRQNGEGVLRRRRVR